MPSKTSYLITVKMCTRHHGVYMIRLIMDYYYYYYYYYYYQCNSDGSPYTSDNAFTCKVQVDNFKVLIEGMAARPQDYVSDHGRLTTNTIEGFHGLALVYRSKRTDLGHAHYTCKTNMAICHKVTPKKLITVLFACLLSYLFFMTL